MQILTDEGIIKRIPVPTNALVNRATADWYLDRMRAETEWRLGYLAIVEHEKPYFPNSTLPFDGVDGSLVNHVDTSRRNPQPHRNDPFRTAEQYPTLSLNTLS